MTDITHIWTEFQKELKGFIVNKTRNHADSNDILQDVFIKIIKYNDKVSQAKNIRHYLYGIVRNALNDYFKRKGYHTTSEIELAEELTEEESHSLNATIANECVRKFIYKLPSHYQQALLLSEFENISQKELAEKLQISYSGAKSRVQRGREKLKELLLKCCILQVDNYGNIIEMNDKPCDDKCN
ncbi:hypothetical protein AD998_17555 [bacterium 336/3]|nr:hypothetical protein AD998_17555 [bacterium 336/3]